MKWYITQPDPVTPEVNSVRIVRKELGSEAADLVLKWPYMPAVTRVAGQREVPNYVPQLDAEGNPVLDEIGTPVYVEDGTREEDIIESVQWPYLIADGVTLRAATTEEMAAIDAAVKAKADQADAARKAAMAAKLTPGIVGLASAYRTALRTLFGEGAEVNRAITKERVTGAMLQLPAAQYDAKTADMLKLAFEELYAIAGDGTTWTFFETVGDLIPEAQA